jgi:hypothetical protein
MEVPDKNLIVTDIWKWLMGRWRPRLTFGWDLGARGALLIGLGFEAMGKIGLGDKQVLWRCLR